MSLKVGSLFSGYGGLDLAVEEVIGARPAWFCEWEEAPSKILASHWPNVPNLRDVTKVDWSQVEPVDIITGGSPCQDLSAAGRRAGMTEGTRSNLWVNMREAIAIIKPRLVVWENVLGALSATATSDSDMEPGTGLLGNPTGGHLRALGRVLGDLTEIGYDATWTTLRASDIGAPHHRARVFLIAYPQEISHPEGRGRDHGQAPDDGQTNREVNAPRNDCDDPADPERHDGGAGAVEGSGGGSPIGATATGGPEHCRGAEDEDPTDTSGRRIQPDYGITGRSTACGERDGRTDGGYRSEVVAHTAGKSFGEHSGKPSSEETRAEGSYGSGDPGRKRSDGVGGKDSSDSHSIGSQAGHERPVGSADCHNRDMEWGEYAPAVRRWEQIIGPAPAPTEPNAKGNPHLSAPFAEWMMGLPPGWVTAPEIGLTRAEQLKAIGNGVCPPQAIAALHQLLQP